MRQKGPGAIPAPLLAIPAAGPPGGSNLPPGAGDRIFIPNVKEQVKAFRELDLPEGEEQQAEAFIAAMQEGIEATDRKTFTAANIEELGRGFHKASPRAWALGIDSCGFGALRGKSTGRPTSGRCMRR